MNSSAIYGGETYEIRNHVGFSPINFLTGHSYYQFNLNIFTIDVTLWNTNDKTEYEK